jgi:hypothetical protein
MKLPLAIVALTACVWSAPSAAQKCVGLLEIPSGTPSNAIKAFIKSFGDKQPPCGSGKVVLSRVINREKTGGRKLEPDKPFDLKKAQANLEAALKDPAIKARIDKAHADIKDENVLLAYEAAVFDDEGYYDARELKIQQLLQRIN